MASLFRHPPPDRLVTLTLLQICASPPLTRKEVDKYFAHFKKVADSLNWVLLLQSVLVGKAQEIYGRVLIIKMLKRKSSKLMS